MLTFNFHKYKTCLFCSWNSVARRFAIHWIPWILKNKKRLHIELLRRYVYITSTQAIWQFQIVLWFLFFFLPFFCVVLHTVIAFFCFTLCSAKTMLSYASIPVILRFNKSTFWYTYLPVIWSQMIVKWQTNEEHSTDKYKSGIDLFSSSEKTNIHKLAQIIIVVYCIIVNNWCEFALCSSVFMSE